MMEKQNRLWKVDEQLFASMEGHYQSQREKAFFVNLRRKQENEISLCNDVILSERFNTDEIYLVRLIYDEYIVGKGCDESHETLVMNLSEALPINLHTFGLDADITLSDWLRQRDYAGLTYDNNYGKGEGRLRHGFTDDVDETLFYDFATQGYDLAFTYNGRRYYFLSTSDYVALSDDHFTKESQRFANGIAALEQFTINNIPLIRLIDQLEDVEPY